MEKTHKEQLKPLGSFFTYQTGTQRFPGRNFSDPCPPATRIFPKRQRASSIARRSNKYFAPTEELWGCAGTIPPASRDRTTAMPRSAAFEIGVKQLYGYLCAICESGLRTPNSRPEVQSAHIYPKGRDGGDDVRNGICQCRRHQWAMDAGWIFIDDDHIVLVREDLPDHDDYRFIAEYQGGSIRLPSVVEAAPAAMYLKEHWKLTKLE
jgi:hypothetical protein